MKAKLLYEKKEQIEDICFFFLCTEFYCRVFLIISKNTKRNRKTDCAENPRHPKETENIAAKTQ